MKTCTKCKEIKAFTAFSKRAAMLDGLRSQCKACDAIHNDKWAAEHPGYQAKYCADNIEKRKAYKVQWNADNSDTRRTYKHNRRARKLEGGGTLSKGLAGRLFAAQRGKCACGCGQPLGENYHLDHRMPLALGGTNTDNNIQLLRPLCNKQKHCKHPVDFMQQRGFLL